MSESGRLEHGVRINGMPLVEWCKKPAVNLPSSSSVVLEQVTKNRDIADPEVVNIYVGW